MKSYKCIQFLALCLVFPLGLLSQQKTTQLRIAVTTDVHGAFFPVDWYTKGPSNSSLAHVYQWVQKARQESNDLILLDNGDLIQGDPATYYSNFIQPQEPNIAARVLTFMAYDGATVGNHDIETGHSVYDKLTQEFPFPWMGANAMDISTGAPYFQPYTILMKNGKKVAVLGLTTPKVPSWLPPVLWTGMEFRDMVETARYWVAEIERIEHPDLLVGLFHSGVDPGYTNAHADPFLNENASGLVPEMVNGFDVIFAGHDHQHWNRWVGNPDGDSTLVIGSESRAREFAMVTVSWPADANETTTPTIAGDHIQSSGNSPSSDFIRYFQGYMDTIQSYVDRPLAVLSNPLSNESCYFGTNPFIDLIHRAQLDMSGAEISLAAPLSFRTNLTAGNLTVGSLFHLYRYENLLYTIKLTGREILAYLNYSYSLWVNSMNAATDQMLKMEQSASGQWRFVNPYYNFDSAAGLDYVVDLRYPDGQMVRILGMANGDDFNLNKFYVVALNSYRGSGGGGHLTQGVGLSAEEIQQRLIWVSDHDFRYQLMDWTQQQKKIEPKIISKWEFIPRGWALVAKERGIDYR